MKGDLTRPDARVSVLWAAQRDHGLEHLRLDMTGGITAASTVIFSRARLVHTVGYTLSCDASWQLQRVTVSLPDEGRTLTLVTDSEGHWSTPPAVYFGISQQSRVRVIENSPQSP